ncbi:uncharacterized protein LOC126318340 [Schistocerca gregaria]|uniref:uncharacterized protein LOC126318340 n=1 Tax=Schistocerca gregaria TaxID=7010 RepID=UPI00211F3D24|nr:uncharacterized protein LOC126318340 [Schistocerca gregaria]
MCGIICALGVSDVATAREKVIRMSKCIRHRGPDSSGYWNRGHDILGHERLAIVSLDDGSQPLISIDETTAVAANAEIYNHVDLYQIYGQTKLRSKSDCEVLMYALQQENPEEFLNSIRGIFSFVVSNGEDCLISRDHIGVIPLYWGRDKDGAIWVASEMKALLSECIYFDVFPPGHFYSSRTKELKCYYNPVWFREIPTGEPNFAKLRSAFETAVIRRTKCDVPYGILLSGGLDSSLVASVLTAQLRKVAENGADTGKTTKIHSFCVGFDKNSPDLRYARQLADFLGTKHHEVILSIQQGIDSIEDVIWYTETYDVTTIRSSVPMYLLARKIRSLGIKMILSGEGSDEIFGGYLYFHGTDDPKKFHEENVKLLNELHVFDCLRANKSLAAFGIESRVPFLDRDFLDAAFSFDPKFKCSIDGRIEKWVLRKTFDDADIILPSLLWRQKEQLSDGVGYSWIDELIQHTNNKVSDYMFSCREMLYPHNTPSTKEAFYYREIFERLFPHRSAVGTVKKWVPNWSKDLDPSGRRQLTHQYSTYTVSASSCS